MRKIFRNILCALPLATVAIVPALNLTSCSNTTFQISKVKSLIELHNHLDGAVTLKEARKLSGLLQNSDLITDNAKAATDVSTLTDEELSEKIQVKKNCPSLTEFLKKFDFINKLIVTTENAKTLAKDVCDGLADQGVIYAELRFCPQFFNQHASEEGVYKDNAKIPSTEDFLKAVIEGVNNSKLKESCGLILCLNRMSKDRDEHQLILNLAKEYKDKGVCAIDLACDEAGNPLYPESETGPLLCEYITKAKEMGLNITLHAGESQKENTTDAIKNINTAIDLGATRIGHGTYAQYDETTMQKLAANNITLEVCPYSNYMTKGVSSYESHPIKTFIQYNIPVCLSTDDPGVENESLQEEWQRAINTFNFCKSDVEQMMLNSAKAAFVSVDKKLQLYSAIKQDFKKL